MVIGPWKRAVLGLLACGALVSGASLAAPGVELPGDGTPGPQAPTIPGLEKSHRPQSGEQSATRSIVKPAIPAHTPKSKGRTSPSSKSLDRGPIHELEAQLGISTRHYLRCRTLHQSKAIPEEVYDEAFGMIELIKAQLEDVIESLEEDRIRLDHELAKANAEVAIEAVRVRIASRVVERDEHLNATTKDAVTEDERVNDQNALELARAERDSSKADAESAKAMIELVDKRIAAAKAVLKKASAVEPPDDEGKLAPGT